MENAENKGFSEGYVAARTPMYPARNRSGAVKGLVRKHRKYAYQARVPSDLQAVFGLKKYQRVLNTDDPVIAEGLAREAEREFRTRVNKARQARLDGEKVPPERIQQVIGYLFGLLFQRINLDDQYTIEDMIRSQVIEQVNEGHPLFRGLYWEGPVFEQISKQVESLIEWSHTTAFSEPFRSKKTDKPEATLMGAATIWSQRSARTNEHTKKTRDQYIKDVRGFTAWFETKRGPCHGIAISKKDVNQYVVWMMDRKAAKATIMRSLSALRLVYKSGQFSDENPFSGVTDRMVIYGGKLEVRKFTDREVMRLLKAKADANSHMAVLIAAYSGMRLSEITSLKIEHVERIGQHRVFNLMNAGRRKTEAGYRKVPIHSEVWRELGLFIKGRDESEYILAGEPEDKYGARSAALSKRVNRLIDVIAPDEEAREHSFRHTFISKMKEVGIQKEWRKDIVGHAGEDVHDDYTHAEFIAHLIHEIEKVEYA